MQITDRHLEAAFIEEMKLWQDAAMGAEGAEQVRLMKRMQKVYDGGMDDPHVIARARVMAAREEAWGRAFDSVGGFKGIEMLNNLSRKAMGKP